ncbi:hypothetical protein BDB00DRAFT_82314 [Zychaea mexicana]|uniref:uncharacterized protein n=1 Tax=Zychaea mexicana TaxID=64656 RepID=UPI0022FF44D1|nr:uncharacterized protein BDB00DRAFT_82314 [Zychaea mexicana]KAI9487941.1 hypothetical protein BDB00DRAFT_82314 [Zychaea mexicana]
MFSSATALCSPLLPLFLWFDAFLARFVCGVSPPLLVAFWALLSLTACGRRGSVCSVHLGRLGHEDAGRLFSYVGRFEVEPSPSNVSLEHKNADGFHQ